MRGKQMAEFQGKIAHDIRDSVPDWAPYVEPQAKPGAPNVLFIIWDDMGFGSWERFGGRIRMPNMDRLAARGIQFSQFHTTALCSPTRASLLTGRNATSNGMSVIGEMASGFPNSSCLIPAENGFISEVLREAGYNTLAVGKWHLSPATEMSMGASKRTWPLGRGFDRFYGFLGGLTDQWYPDLWYDNHQIEPPATPAEGYHLSKDLTDKAVEFLIDSASTAPGKPWFLYFAPGACHAPHHVFKDWSDRYKGVFDDGYELYRETTLARQIELGLVPADTVLPPLNPMADETSADGKPWPASEIVKPWEALTDAERTLFVRQAEVYAGFASYTDDQVGRILDHLEATGQADNTIIVTLSDNGASAEGGPSGSVNENRWYNGVPENPEKNALLVDELGLETTHPHYSNGWATAFNTPFKMYKTHASWEGGTADPLIISWPAGGIEPGGTRDGYIHVTDLAPTLYDLLDITPPDTVRHVPQTPLEGVSHAAVVKDAVAEQPKKTQFYSMFGTRAMWAEGWQASTIHAATPSGWSHFDQDRWTLYHLDSDRNQLHDLSSTEPEKLAELKRLWEDQAEIYHGYPLEDRSVAEIAATAAADAPELFDFGASLTLYPGGSEVPERSFQMINTSFRIEASITVQDAGADGVIFSAGGRFGGHALYLRDGVPVYVYNWLGEREQRIEGSGPLLVGGHILTVDFLKTGHEGPSPSGPVILTVDGTEAARADIRIQPAYFSLNGEGVNIGRDRGQPVSGDYSSPFPLTGATIATVVLTPGDDAVVDHHRELEAGFHRD
ncbi:arylsulfatase [Herbiconiux oxytropis]|nr:arylsulfatase [Herbiconiux oxytropis]